MLKRNIFLRAAVLLFVACMALTSLFSGTATFAKYIAGGAGEVTARVAKFSFKVTDEGFEFDDPPVPGGATAVANANKELADANSIKAGIATEFYLPLFDTEYLGSNRHVGAPLFNPDTRGVVTVQSKNGDPLIAPGVGGARGNPVNVGVASTDNEIAHEIEIQNLSEVAVRFRIVYDGTDGVQVPIHMRGENVTGSYANATYGNAGALTAAGWQTFPRPVAGTTEFYPWFNLPPNSAVVTRRICWSVPFATMMATGLILDTNDDPAKGHWEFTHEDTDAIDTALGKKAAKYLKDGLNPEDVHLELKFRIEVEQVD